MNANDPPKQKFKRPKQNTNSTTNPSKTRVPHNDENRGSKSLCPLLAKDSEWVDNLQSPAPETSKSTIYTSDEEEVLQLVECEEGPEMKPIAIMFPGLLEKDPLTLQRILNKAMSTTEVTKHLVDLGQNANFTFMKKTNRLIPRDKRWLESLTENSNSYCSVNSSGLFSSMSNDYDADTEFNEEESNDNCKLKIKEQFVDKNLVFNPEITHYLTTQENEAASTTNQQVDDLHNKEEKNNI